MPEGTREKGVFTGQPTSDKAISFSDYERYGCPVCLTGEKAGCVLVYGRGASIFSCGRCGVAYIVCKDGIDVSPFGVGGVYHRVSVHPRWV